MALHEKGEKIKGFDDHFQNYERKPYHLSKTSRGIDCSVEDSPSFCNKKGGWGRESRRKTKGSCDSVHTFRITGLILPQQPNIYSLSSP